MIHPSSNNGKGAVAEHATIVVLLVDQNVAIVAPVRGPRVLDEPILLAIQLAVANGQHLMVQIVRVTRLVIVDAVRVEGEGTQRCIDGNGHGAVIEQGQLHRLSIPFGHVVEATDSDGLVDRSIMALAVDAQVVAVLLLRG